MASIESPKEDVRITINYIEETGALGSTQSKVLVAGNRCNWQESLLRALDETPDIIVNLC